MKLSFLDKIGILIISFFLILITYLFLFGNKESVKIAGHTIAPVCVGNEPPNLGKKLDQCQHLPLIQKFYEGFPNNDSLYEKEVKSVISCARNYLEQIKTLPKTMIISCDIDDTILSTYPYTLQFSVCNNKNLQQVNNELKPIKIVIDFVKYLHSMGGKIFFITARKDVNSVKKITEQQLDEIGLKGVYEKVFYRPNYDINEDCTYFKQNTRKALENEFGDIFMSIGDQWCDIGKYGGKGVKLPNPMYEI